MKNPDEILDDAGCETLVYDPGRVNAASDAGHGEGPPPHNASPEHATKEDGAISLGDFYAFMPLHNYIYAPGRAHWPGASVNSRLPWIELTDAAGRPILDEKGRQKVIAPTQWLDKHKPVEQMTWAPGRPLLIRDNLIIEGGWVRKAGAVVFNLYRHPEPLPGGDADKAGPWLDHIRFVYPDDADHIVNWMAHRVQRPEEKINHALLLGGDQGIGKDTILEPVKRAIGPWNFREASPKQVLGRFNGFLKAVILRISEARDLGEYDRFAFYDHMKTYTAAPPDTLRIDEKNLREYDIPNVCGVIITTNHKLDGIYLSHDDRRHYVAWSSLQKEHHRFQNGYWSDLWRWYDAGGIAHVAAYLRRVDISGFNPKAPPPKTAAFLSIVDSNRPSEESELADAIDRLENRDAFTLIQLRNITQDTSLAEWLDDRKNRRTIPYRLEQCGYVPVRNDAAADGLWKLNGKRQVIYAKAALSPREQLKTAQKMT
jgi:hypothetical protein